MDGFFQVFEQETGGMPLLDRDETLKLIKRKMIDIEEFMENKWVPTFLTNLIEGLVADGHLPIVDVDDLRDCLDIAMGEINQRRQELYGITEEKV